MSRILCILVLLLSYTNGIAQEVPTKQQITDHYGFEEKSIQVDDENIVFYTYQKGQLPKTKLVVYLQGSDPSPQFSYRIKDDKVQKLCWLSSEFKELPQEYVYVVIEKIGFEGLINEDAIPTPKIYQEKNSLANRVFRANTVIDHLTSAYEFTKVIVYGHSEGAPVGAKLATVNENITHLGFWAGNALPDYYDFILENRIEYYKGAISDSTAQARIDKTIAGFKEVVSDSLHTDSKGYTNLRWWSYAEPPINNLLKIDIPIFVQVASKDKSAPVESSYLIPLEFARLKKQNLTYRVCVGCDHGFSRTNKNGKLEQLWKPIFMDFIAWTEEKAP